MNKANKLLLLFAKLGTVKFEHGDWTSTIVPDGAAGFDWMRRHRCGAPQYSVCFRFEAEKLAIVEAYRQLRGKYDTVQIGWHYNLGDEPDVILRLLWPKTNGGYKRYHGKTELDAVLAAVEGEL